MADHVLPRSLLLPVETTNREFDGKLLLALKALELGYEPIIGSRTAMHAVLPSLPRSIYLAKGARSGSARVFSLLEALGHVIVALDEEALVRFPDEAFHMKLDPETFNRPRLLYAWGKSNADVWRSFHDYRGAPVIEAGNPRIDMLRPEIREYYRNDCVALQQRYGRFVLLSSNFAFVNHFIPNHVRHRIARSANKAKSDVVKSGFTAHKKALFEKFLALVPILAKAIAPHALVIRPHPSENAAAWQDAAKGLANVHVLHEGPMAPWLMAANVLVHNGCTSAIEAGVLGTPAIAYRPVRSAHDLDLPNKLSLEIDAAPAVIKACQMQLSRNSAPAGGPTPQQVAVMENHIACLTGPLSSDRILTSFEEFQGALAAPSSVSVKAKLQALSHHYFRKLSRSITTRIKTSASSRAYTLHKFPDMTLSQVREKVRSLEMTTGTKAARVVEMRPNIFTLVSG